MKDNLLIEAFSNSFRVRDKQEIYEWAAKHVDLPVGGGYSIGGKFDSSISKYMEQPLRDLQNPLIREVVIMKGVQSGGSTIADIFYPWLMINNPCSVLSLMQDEDASKDYTRIRVFPVLSRCKPIQNLLKYEKHLKTVQSIIFENGLSLLFNGANEGNVQSLSIPVVVGDECWKWKSGIMRQLKARTSAFPETSKTLFISQAGEENDDFDVEWKTGHQAKWGFVCPNCNKLQEYVWNEKRDDGTFYGIYFDRSKRDKDDNIIISEAAASACFECKYCKHHILDTPSNRSKMNASGDYIITNPNADPTIKSYWWPSWARSNRKLSDIVSMYLQAKKESKIGLNNSIKIFYQQQIAQSWGNQITVNVQPIVISEPTTEGTEWKDERYRFMAVDCQSDVKRFCVIVRAWSDNGASRLLHSNYYNDINEVRKLQLDMKIKDQHVFIDSGNYAIRVYNIALGYGHAGLIKGKKRWFSWNCTKGFDVPFFYVKDPAVSSAKSIYKEGWGDPHTLINGNKLLAPLWSFSNESYKDILHNLKSGKGAEWSCPESLLTPEYTKQMSSEKKEKTLDKKTGRDKYRWIKISESIDNDYYDCEVIQVLAATITGLIKQS